MAEDSKKRALRAASVKVPKEPVGKPARIRLGMVGGGEGAFIGAVHRYAARLDDQYELVAGALSSTPEKALRSGRAVGLAEERIYRDFQTMALAEPLRADGIEAVAIVTPNDLHAPVAKAFLHAGIHVICDKPVTTTSRDARTLQKLAAEKHLVFAVTHNYSGYPMVRQARDMVRSGALGDLRVVQVEYPQDWLAERVETGHKQASWRVDPKRSGLGGCVGDIGTHAYHLADYVTGIRVLEVCAELSVFVEGRVLDDNAQVMLRYENGARGMLWSSQVAVGNENGLRIRVYGSKGGLEWHQEHPNQLWWCPLGGGKQLLSRGSGSLSAAAARVTRIPGGHPEGYLEAFATVYSEVAQAIRATRPGGPRADPLAHYPTVDDGMRGVQFIEAVVESSRKGGRWVRLRA